MLVKIHKTYRMVIAICDSELLGKRFEEGDRILDVRVSFYDGDKVSEEEVLDLMQNLSSEDATFHITGEKSINTALKAGIIKEGGVKKVQGVPFALVLL